MNWKPRLQKYFDEAWGLGLFMISAGFFSALLEYPGLPLRGLIPSPLLRRFLIGLAMGLTALYIFTSRAGRQSGAYINPAVTMVRYQLGDISRTDALFYTLFQFIGGSIGVWLVYIFFPRWMEHPDVNYVVTVPGAAGLTVAFMLEFLISMIVILVVLFMGRKKETDHYTPYVVATLIMIFITFEAPFSGMSMNPARTFASAIVANQWTSFWIYCTAPLLGMWSGMMIFLTFRKN